MTGWAEYHPRPSRQLTGAIGHNEKRKKEIKKESKPHFALRKEIKKYSYN